MRGGEVIIQYFLRGFFENAGAERMINKFKHIHKQKGYNGKR